ncbi:RING-15 protein [Podospora aff. communis PSN243]|uniref:RING-15 protein n=1 Tax=Podospora aff. communis PSN243 TaxID=3040156 RepID=A0AAV9GJ06_9PEZI|nr:RING-15 protein [Podospora aff. communis PSN243]
MSLTPSIPIKSSSAPAAPLPPQTSAAAAGFDITRRPNNNNTNSGSGSSGQSIFAPQANPRKAQAARKQHRSSKRPGANSMHRGLEDDDDAMAELRAVRNASSRRGQTSITHLMNYALPPRPNYDSHHALSSRSYRRNPTWGMGSGHHAIDKARYVHANYRFVVSPGGSYASQAVDADEHLEWADVWQIIASAESQQTSCPICLSEPVAPRMAKCGHIFCLPCLLRFMNSMVENGQEKKQNRWRKCPICEDAVFIAEVRPVKFYAGQESPLPRPGDDVILRLMMRNAKSTLALPREGGAEVLNAGEDIPWHFAANVLDYARIIKGTGGYMEEEYDREVEELLKQEKEDELLFHQDNEWTQKAIRAVTAAKEKVKGLGDIESAGSSIPVATKKGGEMDFYFYSSAPHLYLSPLDIRILKTRYGSFSAFPSTLLPRVEHISTGHVVDDNLRRRAKYLNHLPHGCLISFLECEWTDIVPAEILEPFKDEIERRRKRNRDKAAQEERERVQAERLEAAALRGTRRNMGALDEDVTVRFGNTIPHNPPIDINDFIPLGAEPSTTPPNPRLGFGHLSDVSTSPSGRRTVWGTPAIAGDPEAVAVQTRMAAVDDGWLKDDDVLETLGAPDLAFQMEAMGLEAGPSREGSSTPATGGGGGKKKKKQKITLMSTGGRRGN